MREGRRAGMKEGKERKVVRREYVKSAGRKRKEKPALTWF